MGLSPDLRPFLTEISQPSILTFATACLYENLSVYGPTRFKLTDRLALIGGGRFVDCDTELRFDRK